MVLGPKDLEKFGKSDLLKILKVEKGIDATILDDSIIGRFFDVSHLREPIIESLRSRYKRAGWYVSSAYSPSEDGQSCEISLEYK